MDLNQIKEAIQKAGFSAEALERLNQILEAASARGALTDEEKNQLLTIIDLELEANDLEAEACSDVVAAIDDFAAEVNPAVEEVNKKLDEAQKTFETNISEVEQGNSNQ